MRHLSADERRLIGRAARAESGEESEESHSHASHDRAQLASDRYRPPPISITPSSPRKRHAHGMRSPTPRTRASMHSGVEPSPRMPHDELAPPSHDLTSPHSPFSASSACLKCHQKLAGGRNAARGSLSPPTEGQHRRSCNCVPKFSSPIAPQPVIELTSSSSELDRIRSRTMRVTPSIIARESARERSQLLLEYAQAFEPDALAALRPPSPRARYLEPRPAFIDQRALSLSDHQPNSPPWYHGGELGW
jgi:hypothetical protein